MLLPWRSSLSFPVHAYVAQMGHMVRVEEASSCLRMESEPHAYMLTRLNQVMTVLGMHPNVSCCLAGKDSGPCMGIVRTAQDTATCMSLA